MTEEDLREIEAMLNEIKGVHYNTRILSQTQSHLDRGHLIAIAEVLIDGMNELLARDKILRQRAEKAEGRVEVLERRVVEMGEYLGDLLAVIHGDGGNYVLEHGWEKASEAAEAHCRKTFADLDYATTRVAELEAEKSEFWRSAENTSKELQNWPEWKRKGGAIQPEVPVLKAKIAKLQKAHAKIADLLDEYQWPHADEQAPWCPIGEAHEIAAKHGEPDE